MGCGKSRLDHSEVDSNENVPVTREVDVVESETEQAKIEAVLEATDIQSSKNRESKLPTFKQTTTGKPTVISRNLSRARKSENRREIELNAWGEKKPTKKNVQNIALKLQGESGDDSEFESEYGRDGVDLTSTHVTNDHETEKLMSNSLGPRSSPDGTNLTNYREGPNRISAALQKVESDETFDPSTLIDIEKFKAANAPTKQTNTSAHDSEGTNENDVSVTDKNVAEAENSANYDKFYDDDEKELIASIEKNFVTLSPPVLPGSVI